MTRRIAIHVEDPGALNFLIDLPQQLAERGMAVDVFADGFAASALASHAAAAFVRAEAPAAYIARARPDLVIAGTSENRSSRALELLARAREAAIATAAVVDLPVNAAARFAGTTSDPLAFAPAVIWCADDATVAAFRALGVAPERIERVRNPRLEALREQRANGVDRTALRRRLFPAWNGAPIVVFAAEPASALDARRSHDDGSYTLHGTSGATWRTTIVLEEVIRTVRALGEPVYIVVRLHPKNTDDDVAAQRDRIDQVHRGGDPAELLIAADLVVGLSSMILQEAAAVGARVLAVVPRAAERSWLPMIADGTIPAVTTRAALDRALPALLHGPSPAPAPLERTPSLLDAVLARVR